MPKNYKTKQGFTIIEVVLVLAVAGLIFLMVFIALPSLQRTQRDTQRRQDYSILSTAVTNYIANNGGKLSKLTAARSGSQDPAGMNTDLDEKTWINVDGLDPNGYPYELTAYSYDYWSNNGTPIPGNEVTITETDASGTASTSTGPGSQVFIITGANCNATDNQGNSKPDGDRATRAYAIYGYLEVGGTYCQDVGKTISDD